MQTTGVSSIKSILLAVVLCACPAKPAAEPITLFQPLFPSAEGLPWSRIELEKISEPKMRIVVDPSQSLDRFRVITFLKALSTVTAVAVQTDRSFKDHGLDPAEWAIRVQSGDTVFSLFLGEIGGQLENGEASISRWARVQNSPYPYLLRGSFIEIMNQISSEKFFRRTRLFLDRIESLKLRQGKKAKVFPRNAKNDGLFAALEQTRFLDEASASETERIRGLAKLELEVQPMGAILRLFAESGRLYVVSENSVFELYPESLRIFNRITGSDLRP